MVAADNSAPPLTENLGPFSFGTGLATLAIYWTLILVAEWLGMTEADLFVTESEEPA